MRRIAPRADAGPPLNPPRSEAELPFQFVIMDAPFGGVAPQANDATADRGLQFFSISGKSDEGNGILNKKSTLECCNRKSS